MSNVMRKLGGQSVLYAMGTILTRALGFLLLPVYSNVLHTSPFGDYVLVYTFLAFGNVIFLFGMDAAFLRFYVPEKDTEKRRRIFSTVFLSLSGAAVVFCAAIYYTAGWWAQIIFRPVDAGMYIRFMEWAAVILALDALTMAGLLLYRANQQGGRFVLIRLLAVIINFLFNIYFVLIVRSGVEGILWANVLASATGLMLVMPVVWKNLRPVFSRDDCTAMLRFGLPYIFPGLAMIAMEMLGRLQVDYYLGRDVQGIFSANYRLGIFLSLVVAGFRMAWQPFFLSHAGKPGDKQMFAGVFTYCTAILLWGFVGVGTLASELVRMPLPGGYHFLASSYWGGLSIIPWVLGGYVFYGWYVNFVAGIYITKKSLWLPVVTGAGAGLNFLLNILLIPRWGINGAAIGGCLAYAGMAMLLWAVSRSFYKVDYEYGRIAKLCLIALTTFAIGYWQGMDTSIYQKMLAVVLYPALVLGLKVISPAGFKELGMFQRVFKR